MSIRYTALIKNPLKYVLITDGRISLDGPAEEAIIAEAVRYALRCHITRPTSIQAIETELRISMWDRIKAEIRKHDEILAVTNSGQDSKCIRDST